MDGFSHIFSLVLGPMEQGKVGEEGERGKSDMLFALLLPGAFPPLLQMVAIKMAPGAKNDLRSR